MRSCLLSLLWVLAACDDASTREPQPEPQSPPSAAHSDASDPLPDRDPALAHKLVEREGAVLLDVRTEDEFAQGHVEGAHNISHDQLEGRLEEIERLTGGDKSKPIVTYCRSGGRAGKARTMLEAAGYTRVTNVGGMSDYQGE